MISIAQSLLAAFRFLTIAPIPAVWCGDDKNLRQSSWFFPIVGFCLGAIVSFFDFFLLWLFKAPIIVSALDIAVLLVLTKALHIDGLSDSADGFLSSRSKGRMLEIMRDSRVGSMGVIAVLVTMLIKWSALTVLSSARCLTIVLMPFIGRCAILLLLSFLSYARKDGGIATVFAPKTRPAYLIFSIAMLAGVSFLLLGLNGLKCAGICVAATGLFAVYCYKKIGGFTGDTLGAGSEIAEVVFLLAAVALETHGPIS